MSDNYTNILITGGCGFIGSNFIRHLFFKYPEYRIVNLDALTYAGNKENLIDVQEKVAKEPGGDRYTFILGNVCDKDLLDKIFQEYRFKYVVHFAAETHVDRSIFNVSDFIETNINGTRNLIETIRKYPGTQLVHISTDEVYGDVPIGFSNEETLLNPSNPYAASKAGAEMLVKSYMRTFATPAIIVRGSNNYGPYQYPEKLIPLAVSNIIEGKLIPIHGNGQQIRSWLHVLDFCAAIDLIIHQGTIFETYNVAGEEKSVLEILELIAKSLQVELAKHRNHIGGRPGGDMRYAVDSSKLEKQLSWQRNYVLEESIDDVVAWYLNNKSWWQKVKQTKEYANLYERQSKAQWN
ncbi:MAG: dTDP-glucose 4,6-dehydratase [Candidatus Komeilibacteria bacterium RIFCSPLOWO2_02_FULL_48_11]|uniref:dTDP-glucose 4,6-dehydratase n=1 Tax=Candidatus Komeilibacteria bacterium RIFCSPLOWO2_02_FULL_48_11 TaxID=1798553 RepID=A0A1G2BP36_9BACT|nr:MAG: dTDP-glucose 4,6-dehydratase [Candidatus Komeilibacteria bacterium RIFCSPLOWO2_02_FULL_48_11]